MEKEKLNQHITAYQKGFQFFDENTLIIGKFSEFLDEKIKITLPQNVLSLGIGYEIVSSTILKYLKKNVIKKYDIIEGSDAIIKNFLKDNGLSNLDSLNIIHSYFEEFESKTLYDLIEMGFILEHVDNPHQILERYKNFLSPNGVICIGVPNARSLHRLIGYEAGLLADLYALSPADIELGHKRYFDLPKILNLITECGLKYDNIKGIMLKPITTAQMKTLNFNERLYQALLKIGKNYPEISNAIYVEALKI
ncbi:MAG: SAM-dependent methyltransferase [Bacteroidia bacterium]|nr:MAG: SAM-dependent methyltransferase [Bacteroidia bacterium]